MNDTAWGFVLLAAELVGLAAMSLLVGRRRAWWGWLVVLAFVSAPWLVFSITTARWSFLLLSILWAVVHMTNAIRWRTDEHPGELSADDPHR